MIPSTAWSSGASSKMMFAALPPSSSVSFFARARDGAHDLLADLGRARERDLVHVRVLDELRARAAVAGDDVDDPGRQLGLTEHVREQERRERSRLGRLQHDRVPGRERRRDLPGEHEQREVPRDDLPGDADAAAACGWGRRTRACPPSRRSRRSARPRAAGRRRATRGSACRRRATRAPRTRASAPAGPARCGRGTWRARSARAPTSRPRRRRARPPRRASTSSASA